MVYKWFADGCQHEPISYRPFVEWKLEKLAEYQPDYYVNLGDLFEGLGAKRWDRHPSEKWTIRHEFEAVSKYCQRVNEIIPDAKKVFIFGNHDSNLLHEPHRMTDDQRDLVTMCWDELLSGPMKGWIIPCSRYMHHAYWRLGQITFQHGCETGSNKTHPHLERQAVAYGVPFGLHISAHTHSPCPVSQMTKAKVYLPYWYANVGTGADWDHMFYMDRNNKEDWGRAIIRGTVSKRSVDQKKAYYSSPQWTAELLVHSYASQNRFQVA